MHPSRGKAVGRVYCGSARASPRASEPGILPTDFAEIQGLHGACESWWRVAGTEGTAPALILEGLAATIGGRSENLCAKWRFAAGARGGRAKRDARDTLAPSPRARWPRARALRPGTGQVPPPSSSVLQGGGRRARRSHRPRSRPIPPRTLRTRLPSGHQGNPNEPLREDGHRGEWRECAPGASTSGKNTRSQATPAPAGPSTAHTFASRLPLAAQVLQQLAAAGDVEAPGWALPAM